MGCCESTPISTHPTKPTATPPPPPPPQPKSTLINLPQSPPPAPEEEETVKEVLSETPISKPPPPPSQITTTNPNPDIKIKKNEPINLSKPTEQELTAVSEISEASEFCSFSGSFSTTTLNEKDDGEVTQRMGPRSPAKTPRKCTYSGEVRKERGPTRSKRGGGGGQLVRSSRPAVQGRTNTTPHRRNVGPTNGVVRRDTGEVSSRRSRSPAPRGERGGPGKSLGQKCVTGSGVTGQASCKSPVRKVEKVEKENDGVLGENGNESLDNPLVSLECFIFL